MRSDVAERDNLIAGGIPAELKSAFGALETYGKELRASAGD